MAKIWRSVLGVLSICSPSIGEAETEDRPSVAPADMQAVTPALARYTDDVLFGDNWENPRLGKRDRSLITVSALIAGGKSAQLSGHLGRALDNGVTPSEISGLVTHLAFYSGWPNAVSATTIVREVFDQRKIASTENAPVRMSPLSLAPAQKTPRGDEVDAAMAIAAPGLARFTNEIVFADLWRRPDLSPRDRSLVTIAALTMAGDGSQLPSHIDRALDNGVTEVELGEAMTHLAFYAGWPKAMSGAALLREAAEKHAAETSMALIVARRGSGPVSDGPATRFTGKVTVSAPFEASAPSRLSGATVTFDAGARTAWHSHPLGQTLIVTEGLGWTQVEGGPVVEMRAGDVVVCPPGVRHWHGAALTGPMSHVALAETFDGKAVEWGEQVPEVVYRKGPPAEALGKDR
ncbi:carboxymuconolactone decarboxylase family protein [Novosphingobium sp. BL-52-GroH]|uniref:(R)-mandelonitrile lyase n=1 Tax=Novosphingobium sp. BL-52-GroH TaxID=3349877 RepID=UPI00384E8E95